MAREYIYGGQFFKTKKQLADRIRLMLWTYGIGDPLLSRDELLLLDLLKQHPRADEKIGSGLAYFTVQVNPQYPNTRSFWIHRTDGTNTDFSYRICLRPPTQWETVNAAFRQAIYEDVIHFKMMAFAEHPRMRCPVTGDEYEFQDMHVDHKPPNTFIIILKDFITSRNLDIEKVPLITSDGLAGRVLGDDALVATWRGYHGAFADLWVISRDAHVQITKERLLSKDGE